MKNPLRRFALCLICLSLAAGTAAAQDLPRGSIVDDIPCKDDPAQHYALYLPSTFTPARKWPIIFGFDAGGRGARAVERYQQAAETYGYIVVGSNNSRNGPWEPILAAADAMRRDVESRFPIDPKRRYAAGMSGGARVSMALALKGTDIAGVLASSAGFPDNDFQESVRFPVFGTMGTEDFNYDEMHQLDTGLKSPHRIEMFEGGHQWPPIELATDGVEWMEIQAMKRGARPRDARLVDSLFAKRMMRAERQDGLAKVRELKSIAGDFRGLKDVSAVDRLAAGLERRPAVKAEFKAEAVEEQREAETTRQMFDLMDEAGDKKADALAKLADHVSELGRQSKEEADSTGRRFARRLLAMVAADVRAIAQDGQDQRLVDLINQIRPAARPPQ